MRARRIGFIGAFIVFVLLVSSVLTDSAIYARGTLSDVKLLPTAVPTAARSTPGRPSVPLGPSPVKPKSSSGTAAYCPSVGGSTQFESISGVDLATNADGTMQLTVQVYIANPSGCTAGNPCPSYDESPEYVSAWLDWDGSGTWDSSEQVMSVALTGYQAINYSGTMTGISQFTFPSGVKLTNQPTGLRVSLGYGYTPTDPCNFSWTWGNVADSSVLLTHPSITSITSTGIGTTGNEPETGSDVELAAVLNVPAGFTIQTCAWTGQITAGNGDPANNCQYDYVPATGPGPTVATYGNKKATLTITYQQTSTGATGLDSQDHPYKVFFEKGVAGAWGDDNGDGVPNWFEYWKANGAVPQLSIADVIYDQTLSANTYGFFVYPPDDKIHVGDAAPTTHYPGSIVVPAIAGKCPGGTFGGDSVTGIDSISEVLTHEHRHKTIYHNWDPGGIWVGLTDSDTPVTHGRPGDDLPDTYEATLGTDPHNVDSCNLAAHKAPTYATYGDNEYAALVAGNGAVGVASKDWANPGKQTTVPFSATASRNLYQNLHAPLVRSGKAGPNTPYSAVRHQAVTALGSLNGTYSDQGVDLNADGLFDSLELSVGVNITTAGAYDVVGWLADASANPIAFATTHAYLPVGSNQIVKLEFSGPVIRGSLKDGPYKITRVELRTGDEADVVDFADNPYTTSHAYLHTAFDPTAVAFSTPLTDTGVDLNADGLFDQLKIHVPVQVQKAGSYVVIGELEGTSTIAVASTPVALAAGAQSVDLIFNGNTIFQAGVDGPYHLRKLRVQDALGNRIAFIADAYLTSAYTASQFQHGGSTFDRASYTENGLDVNGDGKFDYVHVGLTVNAATAGTYVVRGTLVDSTGASLADVKQTKSLTSGANAIGLNFSGATISALQVNGPYQVTGMTLLDGAGNVLDVQPLALTTQAYSYTQFGPALVALTGTYADHGLDTNGNGLFDQLNVDVNVTAGVAGVVIAQGRLVDGNGIEIQTVQGSATFTAGQTQPVTLAFDGITIFTHGRNGPYTLRDLLVYNSGDPTHAVAVPLAYTTSAYNVNTFERPAGTMFKVFLPDVRHR